MRAVRRLSVMVMALTVLVGCADSMSRSDDESTDSPTSLASARDILRSASAAAKRDDLAELVRTSQRHLERALASSHLTLNWLEYTSPTDSGAQLWDCAGYGRRCHTVILTTDDNWAHSSGLAVPESMADLVDFQPVGAGAVVVQAGEQFTPAWYPPVLLRSDGTVTPLRVSERARDLDGDTVVLSGGIGDAGAPRPLRGRFWAVDVSTAEAYPLRVSGASCCGSWDPAPGRPETVLSFGGYRRKVADGVWRFATTRDDGRSWRTTDVALPLRGPLWDYESAVGPGHLQAVVITEEEQDQPRTIGELWLTDDERAFHRVDLTRAPRDYGGMAFAADGALLIAESTGHHVWRLEPGSAEPALMPDAPRLAESWSTMRSSGGVIIASTGRRTAAASTDGVSWTDVAPGS